MSREAPVIVQRIKRAIAAQVKAGGPHNMCLSLTAEDWAELEICHELSGAATVFGVPVHDIASAVSFVSSRDLSTPLPA